MKPKRKCTYWIASLHPAYSFAISGHDHTGKWAGTVTHAERPTIKSAFRLARKVMRETGCQSIVTQVHKRGRVSRYWEPPE